MKIKHRTSRRGAGARWAPIVPAVLLQQRAFEWTVEQRKVHMQQAAAGPLDARPQLPQQQRGEPTRPAPMPTAAAAARRKRPPPLLKGVGTTPVFDVDRPSLDISAAVQVTAGLHRLHIRRSGRPGAAGGAGLTAGPSSISPAAASAASQRHSAISGWQQPARDGAMLVRQQARTDNPLSGGHVDSESLDLEAQQHGPRGAPGASDDPTPRHSDPDGNNEESKPMSADESRKQMNHALARWNENPANFHQATCVLLLGGKETDRVSSFPRPENVSRMTSAEMGLAWQVASDSISKNEVLVCHFTSMAFASLILGVESPGFKASTVGQGGGGFFVCSVGPQQLGWDQYQGGKFRERTGRELWGENWRHLLEGGEDADKVEIVFYLKIPRAWYDQAPAIPGRELARIIAPELLYESDGSRWLQKEKIVKSYVLLRDAPELEIVGEGPPPQSSAGQKWLFAMLSLAMVLFQTLAVLAILYNTAAPSCESNLQCTGPGTFCGSIGIFKARCATCGEWAAVHAYDSTMGEQHSDRDDDPEYDHFLDAESFCANSTYYREEYCDDSTAYDDYDSTINACVHPACAACPGPDGDPNPGWGVPVRLAATIPGTFDVSFLPDENSTWGTTSQHTVIHGNIHTMQPSDMAMLVLVATIVSFSLADEVRDIKLCELSIDDRAGSNSWRPQGALQLGLLAAWTLGFFGLLGLMMTLLDSTANNALGDYLAVAFAVHLTTVGPAVAAYIDVCCGNSPWRIFLLFLNAVRRFAIVPTVAATVPISVLYDSSNAKDMALNTVGALFLLMVDNEAFAYALPEHIRTHVEEHGRAEIREEEVQLLNAVKTWTWMPLAVVMVLPVVIGRHFHDPAAGLLVAPWWSTWLGLLMAMAFGMLGEAIISGKKAPRGGATDSASALPWLERAAFWVAFSVGCVCGVMWILKLWSGHEGGWMLATLLIVFAVLPLVLWRADKHDGGTRLACYVALVGKYWAGYGMGLVAFGFLVS
jgi:hypothetical protein